MPGSGWVQLPGLVGDGAGQRAIMITAGFGLPPGIDDRAAALADRLVIPHPRLGIDRLADGAQQPQAGEIVLVRPLIAPFDEGADGGGRGVENADAVLLDDLPEAVFVGQLGRPFVHDGGGAVGERAVDDVAVAGHPADVGRAPVGVVFLEVEDPPVVSDVPSR